MAVGVGRSSLIIIGLLFDRMGRRLAVGGGGGGGGACVCVCVCMYVCKQARSQDFTRGSYSGEKWTLSLRGGGGGPLYYTLWSLWPKGGGGSSDPPDPPPGYGPGKYVHVSSGSRGGGGGGRGFNHRRMGTLWLGGQRG